MKRHLRPERDVGIRSPSPRKAWIETPSVISPNKTGQSRLPPGRRGLKLFEGGQQCQERAGRLPPGRRGLKPHGYENRVRRLGRLPPGRRGLKPSVTSTPPSRGASPSPRKAWIETMLSEKRETNSAGRLPPGRRGLKRWLYIIYHIISVSPSPRKAWIETCYRITPHFLGLSPSPRKAWIETVASGTPILPPCVAFPPEGVD